MKLDISIAKKWSPFSKDGYIFYKKFGIENEEKDH